MKKLIISLAGALLFLSLCAPVYADIGVPFEAVINVVITAEEGVVTEEGVLLEKGRVFSSYNRWFDADENVLCMQIYSQDTDEYYNISVTETGQIAVLAYDKEDTVYEEKNYITVGETTLYEGPSDLFAVSHIIEKGAFLKTVSEDGDYYVKVSTEDGRVGWTRKEVIDGESMPTIAEPCEGSFLCIEETVLCDADGNELPISIGQGEIISPDVYMAVHGPKNGRLVRVNYDGQECYADGYGLMLISDIPNTDCELLITDPQMVKLYKEDDFSLAEDVTLNQDEILSVYGANDGYARINIDNRYYILAVPNYMDVRGGPDTGAWLLWSYASPNNSHFINKIIEAGTKYYKDYLLNEYVDTINETEEYEIKNFYSIVDGPYTYILGKGWCEYQDDVQAEEENEPSPSSVEIKEEPEDIPQDVPEDVPQDVPQEASEVILTDVFDTAEKNDNETNVGLIIAAFSVAVAAFGIVLLARKHKKNKDKQVD